MSDDVMTRGENGRAVRSRFPAGSKAVMRRMARALILGRPSATVLHGVIRLLLEPAMKWCESRADRVRHCFAVSGADGLELFVVGRGEALEVSLNREAAELSIRLADEGFPGSIHYIPSYHGEDQSIFFDPAAAVLVFDGGE